MWTIAVCASSQISEGVFAVIQLGGSHDPNTPPSSCQQQRAQHMLDDYDSGLGPVSIILNLASWSVSGHRNS